MQSKKRRLMVVAVAAAVVVVGWAGDALGKGGGERAPVVQAAKSNIDPTYRTVFFSVLEGLYDDGASNEFVDLVLQNDPETGTAMHFIPGCPLCLPSLDALRVYRERAGLSLKIGNTFGRGIEAELVAGIKSESMHQRLEVVETLVARYVARRLDSQRLTDEERGEWRMRMAERRKKGEAYMREMQRAGRAGAFADQKRCGVCDGANEAFDLFD